MKKMITILLCAALLCAAAFSALADQVIPLGDSGLSITLSDDFVTDDLTEEDAVNSIVGYHYDGHTDVIIREIPADDTGADLQDGVPEGAWDLAEGEKIIGGVPVVWCSYVYEGDLGEATGARYAFLSGSHEIQVIITNAAGEDAAEAIMDTLHDGREVQLGTSRFYLELGGRFQPGILDEEDKAAGMTAFYYGDIMDVAVYQFTAENLSIDDFLEDYAEDEAIEINQPREICGTEVGSFFSEGHDGVENHYTYGNVMVDGDSFIEVMIFYYSHEDADEAVALMDTLTVH